MPRMTIAEWSKEGAKRFGESQLQWVFVCPACGHKQKPIDFRPYKAEGATAETGRFNCIGRFSGAKRRAFGGKGEGPCDYTGGGLFNIMPMTVVLPNGEEIRAFDFAEAGS